MISIIDDASYLNNNFPISDVKNSTNDSIAFFSQF